MSSTVFLLNYPFSSGTSLIFPHQPNLNSPNPVRLSSKPYLISHVNQGAGSTCSNFSETLSYPIQSIICWKIHRQSIRLLPEVNPQTQLLMGSSGPSGGLTSTKLWAAGIYTLYFIKLIVVKLPFTNPKSFCVIAVSSGGVK